MDNKDLIPLGESSKDTVIMFEVPQIVKQFIIDSAKDMNMDSKKLANLILLQGIKSTWNDDYKKMLKGVKS